ncbi:3-deoxy-D-manno-octulosonic acid kinase [Halomonas sp. KAO]|uniref:3-deoxy-D-manno-octulosonic acid kinase n=1 Tax=unclassified Halomonas TaxID=2609666 RepID=UPI0018A08EDC|nr:MULTISPECIES: 3-deoxy-D-manno-octulosonic acid kinase [unclassified Halomonas]MBF7053699.1 3-deoxy-D-manno-octulosonic acid kinase [Halomonas sp. KAO]MDT0500978.1 3-deoxy-D-manno-octulosonic acid kinase [Halomonas sp. PAR7]MDT0512714.1 3-deoxy-D-manno-octulosonic acid kinase [Halomonas sp. LES1]MDT0591968.1 3-deoxy-D-manno-octulosonic acid kinase [Halomonas sp. PAR8]
MRLATLRTGKFYILYDKDSLCDADQAPQIGPSTFEPDWWLAQGRVTGQAPGRGASLFLDAGTGEEWVLRPYRRGGMVARFSDARYLWTGLERTRAFREMRLTADLLARDLPVPRPVAANVTRHGLTYEAALLTVRIPGARALASLLENGEADGELLQRVGATIRRFHDTGLDHVDLNARNLLVDKGGKVWLIDLDRCRLRPDGAWKARNLKRLESSVAKFVATEEITRIIERITASYGS